MEKHKAIIKGTVYRREYGFSNRDASKLRRYHPDHDFEHFIHMQDVFIEEKTLWEGEIDSPLLSVGETLYIESLNVEVLINMRVRTTSGNYIYKTDYKFEIVEDDISKKTKDDAEAAKMKYDEEEKERKQIIIEVNRIAEQQRVSREATHIDNYYDENGYLRAFTKNEVNARNNKSWLERLLG